MASTSASTSGGDVLSSTFMGLKSKNPEVRLQSAMELRRHVARSVADVGGDDDNISRRLFELIHSQNSTDNIGGLVAIDHLIDSEGPGQVTIDSSHNLFRFYNYVKHLLPNPDPALILAASKTLGHILAVGGPGFGESFMDHQVPAAMALATASHSGGDKHDALGMARYAGVLILKELALNMPAQFIGHLPAVLDTAVLAPLRDPRLVVREAAAELLAACLEIGAQRERSVSSAGKGSGTSKSAGGGKGGAPPVPSKGSQGGAPSTTTGPAYLAKILQDAQAGLKYTQPEVIHGSLLTIREMLLHAPAVRALSKFKNSTLINVDAAVHARHLL
jgi:FKBP12-rapamycin complex-associated protein